MVLKVYEAEDDDWVFRDEDLSENDFDALDQAIEFWESGNYHSSEAILRQLAQENPSNIDAYHHLSMLYDNAGKELESYLCCREATRIGLDILPKKFDWKESKLNWYSYTNRPFMRAYHALGLWHQRKNEIDSAILIFSRLLAVCPNDNLGVRYLLPELWFKKGDFLSVVRLCKEFEGDIAPEITYNYPLALVLMGQGQGQKAKNLVQTAKKDLPLVAKELLKKRHRRPKSKFPGTITIGGADQAYEYWVRYGEFWANCADATFLLQNG